MFCPKCGNELDGNSASCPKCGNTIPSSISSGVSSASEVTNRPQRSGFMFCSNCGNQVAEKAIACPKCGCPPRKEKNFCYNCGTQINAQQIMCVKCGVSLSKSHSGSSSEGGGKNRIIIGIVAILVGFLGIHKFYHGSWGWGIVYLLISLIGCVLILPLIIIDIVGIVEGIKYLIMDDEEYNQKYVESPRDAFKW